MPGAALQPQQQQATAQTSGIAPLVQSAVLTDRRHILTKDAEGNVDLWDVTTGAVEERFGQVLLQASLNGSGPAAAPLPVTSALLNPPFTGTYVHVMVAAVVPSEPE